MIIRPIEKNDESEVYHMWSRYHIDELPFVWARRLCTIKPIRCILGFAVLYSLAFNFIAGLVLVRGPRTFLGRVLSLYSVVLYRDEWCVDPSPSRSILRACICGFISGDDILCESKKRYERYCFTLGRRLSCCCHR